MVRAIFAFEETIQPHRHRTKGTKDYWRVLGHSELGETARTSDEAIRYGKVIWHARRHQKFFGGAAEVSSPGEAFGFAGYISQPEGGFYLKDKFELLDEERLRLVEGDRQIQVERDQLEKKVRLLEHQLHCDRPYLQVFRLGAASLLLAILSLLVWLFMGVGVPFHPIFATAAIPAATAAIVMAFLIKPKEEDESKS